MNCGEILNYFRNNKIISQFPEKMYRSRRLDGVIMGKVAESFPPVYSKIQGSPNQGEDEEFCTIVFICFLVTDKCKVTNGKFRIVVIGKNAKKLDNVEVGDLIAVQNPAVMLRTRVININSVTVNNNLICIYRTSQKRLDVVEPVPAAKQCTFNGHDDDVDHLYCSVEEELARILGSDEASEYSIAPIISTNDVIISESSQFRSAFSHDSSTPIKRHLTTSAPVGIVVTNNKLSSLNYNYLKNQCSVDSSFVANSLKDNFKRLSKQNLEKHSLSKEDSNSEKLSVESNRFENISTWLRQNSTENLSGLLNGENFKSEFVIVKQPIDSSLREKCNVNSRRRLIDYEAFISKQPSEECEAVSNQLKSTSAVVKLNSEVQFDPGASTSFDLAKEFPDLTPLTDAELAAKYIEESKTSYFVRNTDSNAVPTATTSTTITAATPTTSTTITAATATTSTTITAATATTSSSAPTTNIYPPVMMEVDSENSETEVLNKLLYADKKDLFKLSNRFFSHGHILDSSLIRIVSDEVVLGYCGEECRKSYFYFQFKWINPTRQGTIEQPYCPHCGLKSKLRVFFYCPMKIKLRNNDILDLYLFSENNQNFFQIDPLEYCRSNEIRGMFRLKVVSLLLLEDCMIEYDFVKISGSVIALFTRILKNNSISQNMKSDVKR